MIQSEQFNNDAGNLRRIFSTFPSGAVAVCSIADQVPVGMAVSSFTSVSETPPLVSVCIQSKSKTWPLLRNCPRIGVSILAERHDETCLKLSRNTSDRFKGIDWESSHDGSVFIHEAAAWLDCSVYSEIQAGDHVIVLLEILGMRGSEDVAPLVFHGSRFRKLLPEPLSTK